MRTSPEYGQDLNTIRYDWNSSRVDDACTMLLWHILCLCVCMHLAKQELVASCNMQLGYMYTMMQHGPLH